MTGAATAGPPGHDLPPGRADPVEVRLRGRRFSVDPGREGRFWTRMTAGGYEPRLIEAIEAHAGAGVTFLDIGGWFGPATLFAAAGPARRAIAVEADPVALTWLRRNIALNPRIAAKTTVVDRALSPRPGVVRFGTNRGHGGNSMSSLLHRRMATAWEVRSITPAELIGLAGDGPVFAKMDIEGGEYAALPALAPLFRRPGSGLFLSLHPTLALGDSRRAARARRERRVARATGRMFRALRRLRAFRVGPDGPEPAPRAVAQARLGRAALAGDWLFLSD